MYTLIYVYTIDLKSLWYILIVSCVQQLGTTYYNIDSVAHAD